jgi:beta-glucanase (GH16 family)
MMKPNLWLSKRTIGVLQAVISLAIFLNPASVRADPPGKGWRLTFSDDFNGRSLDRKKWNTCYWWASSGCKLNGNLETQWYQPDDVIIQNGKLRLRTQQRKVNGYRYTSGMISSHDKYSFQYGYVEIRAKMPKGKGLWTAFWLIPQQRNVWPPEIDVMEYLGHDPKGVYLTLHYKNGDRNRISGKYWYGPDFSVGYHTFAVQWEPKRIIWYVDGVERKRYEVAANIPAQPLYLVANLAVGPAWKNTPPDHTTLFPSYYDIDYTKVWQRN